MISFKNVTVLFLTNMLRTFVFCKSANERMSLIEVDANGFAAGSSFFEVSENESTFANFANV